MPPPEYFAQLVPQVIGLTLAFSNTVELLDHLKSPHVRYLLVPLCVLALTKITIYAAYVTDLPFQQETRYQLQAAGVLPLLSTVTPSHRLVPSSRFL